MNFTQNDYNYYTTRWPSMYQELVSYITGFKLSIYSGEK